ncbi:MAG: hypothetical protein LBL01_00155 [Bifidobacteriaceae bacterium]|nr:hypothetical protein [Bifidobacteriaceae bacterium]
MLTPKGGRRRPVAAVLLTSLALTASAASAANAGHQYADGGVTVEVSITPGDAGSEGPSREPSPSPSETGSESAGPTSTSTPPPPPTRSDGPNPSGGATDGSSGSGAPGTPGGDIAFTGWGSAGVILVAAGGIAAGTALVARARRRAGGTG